MTQFSLPINGKLKTEPGSSNAVDLVSTNVVAVEGLPAGATKRASLVGVAIHPHGRVVIGYGNEKLLVIWHRTLPKKIPIADNMAEDTPSA